MSDKQQAKRVGAPPASRRAILFELENLACDGQRRAYEAAKAVLKPKGVELSTILFARFGAGRAPAALAAGILQWAGKERLSAGKLTEDLAAAFREAFSAPGIKIDAALKRLLAAATEKHVALGALTTLEKPVSERLAETLHLQEFGVQVLAHPGDERAPLGADGWLKLARGMRLHASRCVALATTGPSAKAAVAARMHCVAIPSDFSGFQDLGGVDAVAESLNDVRLDSLLALLEPAW